MLVTSWKYYTPRPRSWIRHKHGNAQEYLRKILKPVQTLDIYGALTGGFSLERAGDQPLRLRLSAAGRAVPVGRCVAVSSHAIDATPARCAPDSPVASYAGMTDAKPGSDKITTLEPLLYRATFFVAFASLLEDKTPDATIDRLRDLASSVLGHFDAHAQRTPLLYVEALFGHAGAPSTSTAGRCRMTTGWRPSAVLLHVE